MAKKPLVVFVLGGPGAGKGTQCERILAEFSDWGHVSAGDCLRAERNNPESKDGQLINDFIKEGKIVPSEITVGLMQKAMAAAEGKNKFLIDGFPRDLGNVTTWEEVIGDAAKVVSVFFFDCSEETMEARLLERGKTSGRSDDNIESIRKRFKTFVDESMPIIEKYKETKGLVTRFDAAPPADDVWKKVKSRIIRIERDAKKGEPKPIVLKKPKWTKVEKVNPASKGINLMLKCVSCSEVESEKMWEAVCGDETGVVTVRLRSKEIADTCTSGASLRMQNAKVVMHKGFIRISVDKWAVLKPADEAQSFEVKTSKDISATEYELA